MNRAGLLNFWYYDDEIFNFSDGKLLLRGTNGSGKSVTMQSFLPVLLDGRKTPDRLDPFGSKARRMEDYLLGEKDISQRDERTGYLFLEYKKKDSNQYITTGIGMQARRGKGMKSWYFLITDHRRIGYDFELYEQDQDEKIPFSQKQLENRIHLGGHVVSTQREYMELVNKHIFGFQSTEAFEDLIKLLIQLRSPKLSKDFKPTVVYEILESALPPLTDDELRYLSDTVENMDQTQQQIEQIEREHASSKKLVRHYHLYNQFILYERAKQWDFSTKQYEQIVKEKEQLEKSLQQIQEDCHNLKEALEDHKLKQKLALNEKERLQTNEVWQLQEERVKKQNDLEIDSRKTEQLEQRWDAKNHAYRKELIEREREYEKMERLDDEMADLFAELELSAKESSFTSHEVNISYFHRHEHETIDFTAWHQDVNEHEILLNEIKEISEELERLGKDRAELEKKLSEKKRTVDQFKQQLEHLEDWFTEQNQILMTAVFEWIDQHEHVSISSETSQQIARLIEGLYEHARYEQVREILINGINEYASRLQTEKYKVVEQRLNKQQEIDDMQDQLQYWKTLEMPNPDRADATNESRQELKEKDRAHIPFYAAVEFKDHVTDHQKERIEAALRQTGILDSLIINKDMKPHHDQYLQPDPLLLQTTLADYLYVDLEEGSTVYPEVVDAVLQSIPVEAENGRISVDIDGSYSFGCLVGHAPSFGPARYIGRSSRRKYQQEQIQYYQSKIYELQDEYQQLSHQISIFDDQLLDVEQWKGQIPQDQHLHDLYFEIQELKAKARLEERMLNEIDQQWKSLLFTLRNQQVALHEKSSHLQMTDIREAIQMIQDYRADLHALDKNYEKKKLAQIILKGLDERIAERLEEMDEIKGEQNIVTHKLNQLKGEIERIDQQLQLKGIDEIRERIQQVQVELQEAEYQISHISDQLPRKEENGKTMASQLDEIAVQVKFWGKMSITWEESVTAEVNQQFVEVEERTASAIMTQLVDKVKSYDHAKLATDLTKTTSYEQTNLMEYRMTDFLEREEEPEWFAEEWPIGLQPFINEWKQAQGRRKIILEYKGQRVSPYFIFESLESELMEKKNYLDEQDRQLYEEIIVNSVGMILRSRIQRAQQWVKQMDQIMRNRNNSSGLTFSITWKPLTADTEAELDTQDLVTLLQRNSKFLSEEDLNKMTSHFQSRIERAKEMIRLGNEGMTLHQILKEVLDYRKWFTFVLSFKRENESKRRELTNHAFFQFSGGEKAMAMYIPLFTAAYSRYKEAGEMAPYIISLDEAFAGVDDMNIRDMFQVVEQLDFDYIMNSQVLWGDYDTISSLAICELVRPKNANFVTVIRYKWDGKERIEEQA